VQVTPQAVYDGLEQVRMVDHLTQVSDVLQCSERIRQAEVPRVLFLAEIAPTTFALRPS
jgi:hypothetical protein